ncbi:MAG: tetratricopeptide repeat protein [Bacteroidota bacterium]
MEKKHSHPAWRRGLLFGALLCLLLPQSLRAEEWYVSYQQGLEAFRGKQWQKAIEQFNKAIADRSDPGANAKTYGLRFIDYFPYVYRGVSFYRTGNFKRALQDLQQSERHGEVFDASNDDNAERLLREHLSLLRQYQTDQQTLAEGAGLYRRKDYAEAIERLKTIKSDSPAYAEARQYISKAEADMTKQAEGVKETQSRRPQQTAVDASERDLATGIALFNSKSYDAAERKFHAVLSRDPNNGQALQYLNRIRTERRKLAAASSAKHDQPSKPPPAQPKTRTAKDQTVQRKQVDRPPVADVSDSLFKAGLALYEEGQLRKAKEVFLKLNRLKSTPAEVPGYIDLISQNEEMVRQGVLSYFEGDYGQAITRLTEASGSNRDNASLYGFLASSLATRFFLEGDEDAELRRRATDAYRVAQKLDATYALDSRYISPKIIALLNSR